MKLSTGLEEKQDLSQDQNPQHTENILFQSSSLQDSLSTMNQTLAELAEMQRGELMLEQENSQVATASTVQVALSAITQTLAELDGMLQTQLIEDGAKSAEASTPIENTERKVYARNGDSAISIAKKLDPENPNQALGHLYRSKQIKDIKGDNGYIVPNVRPKKKYTYDPSAYNDKSKQHLDKSARNQIGKQSALNNKIDQQKVIIQQQTHNGVDIFGGWSVKSTTPKTSSLYPLNAINIPNHINYNFLSNSPVQKAKNTNWDWNFGGNLTVAAGFGVQAGVTTDGKSSTGSAALTAGAGLDGNLSIITYNITDNKKKDDGYFVEGCLNIHPIVGAEVCVGSNLERGAKPWANVTFGLGVGAGGTVAIGTSKKIIE